MKGRLIFALLLLGLVSCSPRLTPFSQDLYDRYRWSDEELKNIQFYLSDDIVLYKKGDSSEASIVDGKIRINKENTGERIVIKKGTPGVFLFSPKSNRFAISFHESDDSKYLMFGPNEAINGKYALLAKDWEKYKGTVTYQDQHYTVKADDALSILMVDLEKAVNNQVKHKEEKGRKIN